MSRRVKIGLEWATALTLAKKYNWDTKGELGYLKRTFMYVVQNWKPNDQCNVFKEHLVYRDEADIQSNLIRAHPAGIRMQERQRKCFGVDNGVKKIMAHVVSNGTFVDTDGKEEEEIFSHVKHLMNRKTCPKCGSDRTLKFQIQKRSLDEISNENTECQSCGHIF